MDNKKDVGRLFKDKLKEFSVSPKNINWEDIAKDLEKNKDPILIPWLQKIGVITVIVLASFLIYKSAFKNEKITKSSFIEEITYENLEQDSFRNDSLFRIINNRKNLQTNENDIVIHNTKENIDTKKTLVLTTQPLLNILKSSNTSKLSISETSEATNNLNSSRITNTSSSSISVTSETTNNLNSSRITNSSKIKTFEKDDKIELSNSRLNEDSSKIISKNRKEIETLTTIDNISNSQNVIKDTIVLLKNRILESNTISYKESIKSQIFKGSSNEVLKDEIPFQKVVNKEELSKKNKKDTLIDVTSVEDQKKRNYDKAFSFSIRISPTYLFPREGSLISNTLINNSKEIKPTLSYGGLLTAKLNDKLGVRLSYNRLNFKVKTLDVESDVLSNILSNNEVYSRNIGVQNIQDNRLFDITEDINYQEVAIELSYLLTDNKISVDLIGGFSFLFLESNAMLDSGSNNLNLDSNLGSNNNLETYSNSFNIGSNIKYKLINNMSLTVEPTFKYQLRDLSKNSNSYTPFYFTVPIGLSFDF